MSVYTIGHSNHSPDAFLALLRLHEIEAVADVRSAPYSRRFPAFNKEPLRNLLAKNSIAYEFLGNELGARPSDPSCYSDGRADFALIANSEAFRCGIARLLESASRMRAALLCAEKEPLHCHRCVLIGQVLSERKEEVVHILADGSAESHDEAMERLLRLHGRSEEDLFLSRPERVRTACEMQERKMTRVLKDGEEEE